MAKQKLSTNSKLAIDYRGKRLIVEPNHDAFDRTCSAPECPKFGEHRIVFGQAISEPTCEKHILDVAQAFMGKIDGSLVPHNLASNEPTKVDSKAWTSWDPVADPTPEISQTLMGVPIARPDPVFVFEIIPTEKPKAKKT